MEIAAVYNDDPNSPGFDITVTDIDSGRDRLRILRYDGNGEHPTAPVRGADSVPVTGAAFAVSDYEAPINNPVRYEVTAWTSPTDPDAPGADVDVDEDFFVFGTIYARGEAWLKSISQPALSRRINIVDWNDVSNPGRILGEYDVLGRKNKVVISDVIGGREGTLVITSFPINHIYEYSDWRDLDALFRHGRTLLLQPAGRNYTGELDMYLEVKSVRRTRVGPVGYGVDLNYVYEIGYVEVDRPTTLDEALGLRSWEDLLAEYEDWQGVLDGNTTWLDLLNTP